MTERWQHFYCYGFGQFAHLCLRSDRRRHINETVTLSFKARAWAPMSALGGKISAWFGPTSTDVIADTQAVAPIPRFGDFSQPADAFTSAVQAGQAP
jgi:hypothetical protein